LWFKAYIKAQNSMRKTSQCSSSMRELPKLWLGKRFYQRTWKGIFQTILRFPQKIVLYGLQNKIVLRGVYFIKTLVKGLFQIRFKGRHTSYRLGAKSHLEENELPDSLRSYCSKTCGKNQKSFWFSALPLGSQINISMHVYMASIA
jgi:hypothetical protein